jgi:hypothetical protein
MARVVAALAFPLALTALSGVALAAPADASIVPPEAGFRAVLGTLILGIAGGLVLALLDDGAPCR